MMPHTYYIYCIKDNEIIRSFKVYSPAIHPDVPSGYEEFGDERKQSTKEEFVNISDVAEYLSSRSSGLGIINEVPPHEIHKKNRHPLEAKHLESILNHERRVRKEGAVRRKSAIITPVQ